MSLYAGIPANQSNQTDRPTVRPKDARITLRCGRDKRGVRVPLTAATTLASSPPLTVPLQPFSILTSSSPCCRDREEWMLLLPRLLREGYPAVWLTSHNSNHGCSALSTLMPTVCLLHCCNCTHANVLAAVSSFFKSS